MISEIACLQHMLFLCCLLLTKVSHGKVPNHFFIHGSSSCIRDVWVTEGVGGSGGLTHPDLKRLL